MNGQYDIAIDQYVPEGVALTETQQEYLKVITGLFRVKEKVRMIDVAKFMNKSTGTVHSAMKILNAKGILKTDHSGDICLLMGKIIE